MKFPVGLKKAFEQDPLLVCLGKVLESQITSMFIPPAGSSAGATASNVSPSA
jgi:hypothetical protein